MTIEILRQLKIFLLVAIISGGLVSYVPVPDSLASLMEYGRTHVCFDSGGFGTVAV